MSLSSLSLIEITTRVVLDDFHWVHEKVNSWGHFEGLPGGLFGVFEEPLAVGAFSIPRDKASDFADRKYFLAPFLPLRPDGDVSSSNGGLV